MGIADRLRHRSCPDRRLAACSDARHRSGQDPRRGGQTIPTPASDPHARGFGHPELVERDTCSGDARECLTARPCFAMVRGGEVSEWSKVPDSKSGVPQGTAGSNPALSAAANREPARQSPRGWGRAEPASIFRGVSRPRRPVLPLERQQTGRRSFTGEVTEWSKVHDWKSCVRQRTAGSNPALSASSKQRPDPSGSAR